MYVYDSIELEASNGPYKTCFKTYPVIPVSFVFVPFDLLSAYYFGKPWGRVSNAGSVWFTKTFQTTSQQIVRVIRKEEGR